jgi:tetratricopeptide (TPR) repeat protein
VSTERGELLLSSGRYREALEVAYRALSENPFDDDAQLLGARAHLRLGDHHAALRDAEAVAARSPHDLQAHAVRAGALSELGRHEEALAAAIETTRLAPMWHGAHMTVAAVADRTKGRRELAWQAASRACELAPLDADAHAMMGSVALSWKRFDVAERALLEALRLDPEHVDARHDLGVVRLQQGSYGGAADSFASTLRADPSVEVARRNLQHLVLRWLQRTHLGAWGAWFLLRIALAADSYPARLVVGAVAAAALVWWTRRTLAPLGAQLRVVMWRVVRSSWVATVWFACVMLSLLGNALAAVLPPVGALTSVAASAVLGTGAALLVGCLVSWAGVAAGRLGGRR